MNVLTAREVADRLRMHYNTVLKMLQEGTIPSTMIGSRYRVEESVLKDIMQMNLEAGDEVLADDAYYD